GLMEGTSLFIENEMSPPCLGPAPFVAGVSSPSASGVVIASAPLPPFPPLPPSPSSPQPIRAAAATPLPASIEPLRSRRRPSRLFIRLQYVVSDIQPTPFRLDSHVHLVWMHVSARPSPFPG